MRIMKLGVLAGAALLALGLAGPASAAPVGASAAAMTESSTGTVEKVHLRRYRHCHGPSWDRWCHGPHYGTYYGPGINLYIGPLYGYRHHHRHHHRHHRRHH